MEKMDVIKKLKALSDRGINGEKENATKLLNKLMKKYGITEEELEKALIDSLKQTKPTLIDIKVLPKSMTDGYGGWWNVGCSQNPRTEKQKEAKEERDERLSQARQY